MEQNVFSEHDTTHVSEKKAKLGIKFFFFYLTVYAGFVAIGVLNYELLAIEVFKGINLAVIYGFGLIVLAVLLGVLYNALCNRYEAGTNEKEGNAL
ncbi:MAG: DUF485 domain-containing protein [Chitinophagaceae bacterium]|nr:DUF485 domain-containing protein [Chitinophagaceae bacterium]